MTGNRSGCTDRALPDVFNYVGHPQVSEKLFKLSTVFFIHLYHVVHYVYLDSAMDTG